jgi:putative N6-adenine-specific DNA methylase
MTQRLFVTCHLGLEPTLLHEIQQLGYQARIGNGGVEVQAAGLRDAMICNLHLRTAHRVLWHLFDVERPTKTRLYNAVAAFDWRPFFKNLPTFAVHVPFVDHPEFSNTFYAAQLIKDGICDQLRNTTGERPSVDKKDPQVRISAVISKREASISFDTSLIPLGKRGYKSESVEAPLRENLAAALLMMAGYTPEFTFLDPCCGSGTFLIEAALMASQTAPGLFREQFGFLRHPAFDHQVWNEVRQEARQRIQPLKPRSFFGVEKDPSTYRVLLRTIARAGFMDAIETQCADFRDASLPFMPSFVITNPPFGVRLMDQRIAMLYKALGQLIRHCTSKPARAAIIMHSSTMAQMLGLRPDRQYPVTHGGLDCMFCVYNLK